MYWCYVNFCWVYLYGKFYIGLIEFYCLLNYKEIYWKYSREMIKLGSYVLLYLFGMSFDCKKGFLIVKNVKEYLIWWIG